jgi:hypothetical protein
VCYARPCPPQVRVLREHANWGNQLSYLEDLADISRKFRNERAPEEVRARGGAGKSKTPSVVEIKIGVCR